MSSHKGKKMTRKARRPGGNVFSDLGFDPVEAQSLRIRAELMVKLREFMVRRRLTQVAAARIWGVTQPRVSDLVRGKIDLFSIDTLVDMLAKAGIRVQLRVASQSAKGTHRKAA